MMTALTHGHIGACPLWALIGWGLDQAGLPGFGFCLVLASITLGIGSALALAETLLRKAVA